MLEQRHKKRPFSPTGRGKKLKISKGESSNLSSGISIMSKSQAWKDGNKAYQDKAKIQLDECFELLKSIEE